MIGWILAGVVLTIGATIVTLAWWKLGDQWADEEYKKFGHGGGMPRREGEQPTVIDTKADTPIDPGTSADR